MTPGKNESTVFVIAQKLLALNFAAIHTSSSVRATTRAIAHALTRLAENPELVGPLKGEIDKNIATNG
ncbi:hypothetical protein GSI_07416 [Ganoderma sinense ZZ0214-1]|uniref:Cytochrome P450 n=1 Tax=Ganoderma sinense ZZ0214-1 TaxID=1077348 RepID=A0A2G8S9I6_9APHY|nr:hypothetical protein GSI_07416 [Ganoderma sinense ZZ0214-1]